MALYKYNGKLVTYQGHLTNTQSCCCNKLILRQCNISCPNSDCDGESDDIITNWQMSNFTTSDLNKIVKIEDNDSCWHLSDNTTTTSDAVEVNKTASYDVCSDCCDDCYLCGECEFSSDSTVTVSYDYCYIDWCCDFSTPRTLLNCFDSDWISAAYQEKFTSVTANKTGCSTWTAEDVTISYYNGMSQPNNSCPQPLVTKTGDVVVTYDCTSEAWFLTIDGDGASLFSSLCGNTPSQNNCSGYSFSTDCCSDASNPAYNEFIYRNYSASVALNNNNNCGAP